MTHDTQHAPEAIRDETIAALDAVAGLPYEDEQVDQLEHALQAAALARAAAADVEVVVAALVHDIGRSPLVIEAVGVERGDHAEIAADWLQPRFGDRVAWLALQHVASKRYLRAVEPTYPLSQASERSLRRQGGPMNADERAELESQPWWREAVRLRRWDDAAKDRDADVPPLVDYHSDLVTVAARHGAGATGAQER